MCDGYSGYNKVPDAACAPAGHIYAGYLVDAVPKGKNLDYNEPAVQGIRSHMETVSSVWKKRSKPKAQPLILSKKHALKKVPVIAAFCRGLLAETCPPGIPDG